MKKKFLSILLGLTLSGGMVYPSCALELSCKTITSVCSDYFYAAYGEGFYGFLMYFDFFMEMDQLECSE